MLPSGFEQGALDVVIKDANALRSFPEIQLAGEGELLSVVVVSTSKIVVSVAASGSPFSPRSFVLTLRRTSLLCLLHFDPVISITIKASAPLIDAKVVQAAADVAVTAAAVAGGSGAADIAALAALSLLGCSATSSQDSAGISVLSPFRFDSSWTGVIAGSATAIVVFTVCHCLVSLGFAKVKGESVVEAFESTRFPALSIAFAFALHPGISFSSAQLVWAARSATDIGGAVVGLAYSVSVPLLCTYLMHRFPRTYSTFDHYLRFEEEGQRREPLPPSCCSWCRFNPPPFLFAVMSSVVFPRGTITPSWVPHCFGPFSNRVAPHLLWATTGLWSAVVMAVCALFNAKNVGPCRAVFASAGAAHFIFAVLIIIFRPFPAVYQSVCAGGALLLNAVAFFTSAAAVANETRQSVALLQLVVLLQTGLTVVRLLLDGVALLLLKTVWDDELVSASELWERNKGSVAKGSRRFDLQLDDDDDGDVVLTFMNELDEPIDTFFLPNGSEEGDGVLVLPILEEDVVVVSVASRIEDPVDSFLVQRAGVSVADISKSDMEWILENIESNHQSKKKKKENNTSMLLADFF